MTVDELDISKDTVRKIVVEDLGKKMETLRALCTACIDCRTGLSGCRFLAKKSITVLYHPPYLSDLAPAG